MTIFHTLKYPISDYPTREQIGALPTDLFNRWLHHPAFSSYFHFFPHGDPENVALLRKIIVEYEE